MVWEDCPLITIFTSCPGTSATWVKILTPDKEMFIVAAVMSGVNSLAFRTILTGTATVWRFNLR
jgi:hypothetical protein